MKLRIDGEQLLHDLEHLATFGADPAGGVTRLAYSPADQQARAWLRSQMQACGIETIVDAAGNTIGCYAGTEALPAIALGSHSDTVRQGGRYDGALGVLAGLAVVRTLHEQKLQLRHPIEVIDFAAEEATVLGTFGSQAMIGELTPALLAKPAYDGRSCAEHLRAAGFDPMQIPQATRAPGSIAAYLELHIEQGDQLEHTGTAIGIVEGIVGIRRFGLTIHGQANHAGTTQMARRQDALVAAAQFVLAVQRVAIEHGIVGTVGTLQVSPNVSNVIPGEVQLSFEIRSLQHGTLELAEAALREIAHTLAATFDVISIKEPVASAPMLLDALATCCQQQGVSYRMMPSGAGHDAMCMAKLAPMAMVFVPSQAGISHAPAEYTSAADCTLGAQLLLDAVLLLDQQL
jgi:beta-ureidopropionase / N-carbamoyl-L-amino-acid hydrolase